VVQFIELSLAVDRNNVKVILGNIYRLPNNVVCNYEQFTREMTDILNTFATNGKNVIIAGDYNINLLQINDRPIIKDYFDSIVACGFFSSN